MAASAAILYTSIQSSQSAFSRTSISNPLFSQYPAEIFPCSSYGCSLKTKPHRTQQKKALIQVKSAAAEATAAPERVDKKTMRILVAGGGIGGLVFALAAKKKGFDVMVFEKDISAIRGEGQYRGPIQVQSNALAALEAIDLDVADEVMKAGCITGDRINGLVDGISGSWYVKFDTFTPAADRGLPVTRVISRMTLQQILARAVGDDIIFNDSNVVSFEENGNKVTVVLENGQRHEGDMLIGADGIWSKVRKQLFGQTDATYSDYTCYTGIADYLPVDIETVGYRVFLGHKQYFVASDVGAGKMQWYAFHKEPAGGVDGSLGKKHRLMEIFEGWCDNVIDLIKATEEDVILRRDIYDRTPTLTWGRGRITLLGDSIHAMQPNLGQGGCMAIEDSYQLAFELDKAWTESSEAGTPMDIVGTLKRYEKARRLRVAIIHGLARMAAIMATTYKAYLGVGLGPLSFLTKFRIPHPGRVGGRFFIDLAMPRMLSWVLGGNSSKLEGRAQSCRITDKASSELRKWFEDDDALERALNGEWFLLPHGDSTATSQRFSLKKDENEPCVVGCSSNDNFPGTSIVIPSSQVSQMHARITFKNGSFYVIDLQSEHGTFLTDNEGRRWRVPPNNPTRFHPSYSIEFGSDKKGLFRVKVMGAPRKVEDEVEMLQAV